MSFCLNPDCVEPRNSPQAKFCQSCGSILLLGDRYRTLKPIAAGGFGHTFLAVDQYKPSKPRCVVKQSRPEEQGTRNLQKAAALFIREAQRLEELGKHPQIPELLAYFEQDDRQYLIQEFVEGSNLAQELAESGAFEESQIRQLLKDLLPVLEFVHDRQVIHRDIKPENIIRRSSDNRFVLVDFGASKLATGTALAQTGTVIGSAGYVAPEQALGKASFSSDLYSLGVTCIHLLTQMPPFELFDSSEGAWVWEDYLVNCRLSSSLKQILNKLLENGTSRRYQSAAAVLKDLQSKSIASPVATAPQVSQPSEWKTLQNWNMAAGARMDSATRTRLNTTYILWLIGFLFGMPIRPLKGLHRLYNGKIVTGVLWMIPVVGDIGSLVDLFLIPRMVDECERKARSKLGISESGVPIAPQAAVTQTLLQPTREQQMVKLLKAAQARGGKLSVTQAVMDTSIGFEEVESLLREMMKSGYATVDNDATTGVVVYRFLEM
ncbi:MAG: protein kinase [Geitlerinemataceae cyanobacterium]